MHRIRLLPHLIVAMLALGSGNVAFAGEGSGWGWRLSPLYYWSINIRRNESYSGGGGEPPTDPPPVHFSFEGAFSSNFEGVYDDRLGFIFDVVWVNLANTGENFKLDFEYLQTEIDGFYICRAANRNKSGAKGWRLRFANTVLLLNFDFI
ncbi:MAG: hypothetical protein GQ538_05380 [Xanthomonadales bacterium]|nr:hypothetical protein [Xanthomonadales bacterium]